MNIREWVLKGGGGRCLGIAVEAVILMVISVLQCIDTYVAWNEKNEDSKWWSKYEFALL